MGWGNESLCVGSQLIDQDGCHAHIYGKNTVKILFSGLMTMKLGMQHWRLRPYQFYPNDDPWLTLIYFNCTIH